VLSVRTLLIANRGQIARRIIRTAREMGVRTIAVYAEDDRLAAHVEEADVAVPLGGGTIAESYRNRGAVLDAAAWQGADAIHPGHGFLAASAPFARAVADAGLAWVGPTPEVARLVADDLTVRRLAADADVPTLDSVLLGGDDPAGWAKTAGPLGYPLVVAGGAGVDGRARRPVADADALADAVRATRAEARATAADWTVIAEPLVAGARVVEVPVIADGDGGVIALAEIERSVGPGPRTRFASSPSAALGAEGALRARLADAARRLTAATGMRGVGSMVALVRGGDLWLLDLVPALSLNHAVTEAVTGLDLVRVQLELAAGADLPPPAGPHAHALAAHVRARGPGLLHGWRHGPTPGVRHDDAVEGGASVTVSAGHDPLLATLTASAATADEAAARLGRSLRELHVHGVDADRDELIDLLAGGEVPAEDDPARYERDWQRFNALIGPHLAAAALTDPSRHATHDPIWPFVPTGWRNVGGSVREMRPGETTWRITPTPSGFASQTMAFEHRGQRWDVSYNRVQRDHPLAVRRRTDHVPTPSDLFNVTIGGPTGHTTTIVELIRLDGDVTLVHFGRRGHRCTVHVVGDRYFINSALGQTEFRELPRFAA
jgi:propionyl-CoA carboxylase alpha chain